MLSPLRYHPYRWPVRGWVRPSGKDWDFRRDCPFPFESKVDFWPLGWPFQEPVVGEAVEPVVAVVAFASVPVATGLVVS